MQQTDSVEGDDAELLASLRNLQLAPTDTSIRDIWYAAGRNAAQRQARRWKVLSLGLGLLASGMLARGALPKAHVEPDVRYVHVPPPPSATVGIRDDAMVNFKASAAELATLHAVADKGLDGLPVSNVASDGADFPAFAGRQWMHDIPADIDEENADNHPGGRL